MGARLRTLKEIASAQSRIASALAADLRAQRLWQEALRSEARGDGVRGWIERWKPGRRSPHAQLTDQLAALQKHARELAMWGERVQAELGELEQERVRLLADEQAARDASTAQAEQVAARKKAAAAIYAELDALPTRLDPRYGVLEAKAKALGDGAPGPGAPEEAAELQLKQALSANRELQGALTRTQKVLRRLEATAQEGVDRVDRALAANAATAGARELSRTVAAAVKDHDPDSVEELARETERILADCAERLPRRWRR